MLILEHQVERIGSKSALIPDTINTTRGDKKLPTACRASHHPPIHPNRHHHFHNPGAVNTSPNTDVTVSHPKHRRFLVPHHQSLAPTSLPFGPMPTAASSPPSSIRSIPPLSSSTTNPLPHFLALFYHIRSLILITASVSLVRTRVCPVHRATELRARQERLMVTSSGREAAMLVSLFPM